MYEGLTLMSKTHYPDRYSTVDKGHIFKDMKYDIFKDMMKVYEVLTLMLKRNYLDRYSIVEKRHWHILRYDERVWSNYTNVKETLSR